MVGSILLWAEPYGSRWMIISQNILQEYISYELSNGMGWESFFFSGPLALDLCAFLFIDVDHVDAGFYLDAVSTGCTC